MQGLARAHNAYDRSLPSDYDCSHEPADRIPELSAEQDRSAIRVGSLQEAIAMEKKHPGRIVIVSTTQFCDLKPTNENLSDGEHKTAGENSSVAGTANQQLKAILRAILDDEGTRMRSAYIHFLEAYLDE